MKKIHTPAFLFLFLYGTINLAEAQNVGIGTSTPGEKLEVNGGIKIGNTNKIANGTIRWNEDRNDFEGYNGKSWVSLTGGRSEWGNQYSYSYENAGTGFSLNYNYSTNSRGNSLGNALSTYGDLLVAGARGDLSEYSPNGLYSAGTVRIFQNKNTGWELYPVTTLASPVPAASEYFGHGVALDNDILAVSAPGFSGARGRVYLYQVTTNGSASYQTSIAAIDGLAGDYFGNSISLSNNFLVVGAPARTVGGNSGQGRVSIYTRDAVNNTWALHQSLLASDGEQFARFGEAVSIYGNVVAISAPGATVNGNLYAGKVYLYQFSNGNWSHLQTLEGEADHDRIGTSLFLKQDTLLIGAMQFTGNSIDSSGKVYVYVRNGNSWVLQTVLKPGDGKASDSFGSSVYLSNGYICVGSKNASVGSDDYAGKAYVFKWNGQSWQEQVTLASSNVQSNDHFGSQVAINGNTIFVSAPNSPYREGAQNGRIYLFQK